MKKIILVFVGALVLGTVSGIALFRLGHLGKTEHFVPQNAASDTDEIRPSF